MPVTLIGASFVFGSGYADAFPTAVFVVRRITLPAAPKKLQMASACPCAPRGSRSKARPCTARAASERRVTSSAGS